jgi:hypothetical protein
VLITIDKASQRMAVAVNGRTRYVWQVSTGRSGYGTPSGRFRPQWMARTYFSKKYYDSPMPHSIFFYHGYAIHGTEYIHRLGGPASHGCVRLHPRNAAMLFALVQDHGMASTRIVIGDAIALSRPEQWGKNEEPESRFITLMTDRLMLAEQIERQDALTKMERVRASDALRRMLERSARPLAASEEEPEVAIGVEAHDRAAVPAPVLRTMPSARVQLPLARPHRQAERPYREADRRPVRRTAEPAGRKTPMTSSRPIKPRDRAARVTPKDQAARIRQDRVHERRVEPMPLRRPMRAEQPKRQRVSAAQ